MKDPAGWPRRPGPDRSRKRQPASNRSPFQGSQWEWGVGTRVAPEPRSPKRRQVRRRPGPPVRSRAWPLASKGRWWMRRFPAEMPAGAADGQRPARGSEPARILLRLGQARRQPREGEEPSREGPSRDLSPRAAWSPLRRFLELQLPGRRLPERALRRRLLPERLRPQFPERRPGAQAASQVSHRQDFRSGRGRGALSAGRRPGRYLFRLEARKARLPVGGWQGEERRHRRQGQACRPR